MPGFITNRDTITKIRVTPEIRAACRFVYTANINTSGTHTDLNVNDRVLLVGQTDAVENGIYLVNAEKVLRRAPDANTAERLKPGVMVAITEGDRPGVVYIQTSGKLGENVAYVVANEDISELEAASHTHDNKALLDSYTQTELDLADAVTKRHEHTNKAALDAVEGVNTGDQNLTQAMIVPLSDEETALEVADNVFAFFSPYDFQITEVNIALTTPSTAGDVTVNVKRGGMASTWTQTLAQAEEFKAEALSETLNKGSRLTFEITAAGTGAKGLKVTILGTREEWG